MSLCTVCGFDNVPGHHDEVSDAFICDECLQSGPNPDDAYESFRDG